MENTIQKFRNFVIIINSYISLNIVLMLKKNTEIHTVFIGLFVSYDYFYHVCFSNDILIFFNAALYFYNFFYFFSKVNIFSSLFEMK